MIYLNFNLRNPWSNRWKNIWCKTYETPIKHKYIELEVFKDTTIVVFSFNLTIRQSHSGLMIDVGLMGYSASLHLYDNRHWNVEEGRWMVYTEEDGEH